MASMNYHPHQMIYHSQASSIADQMHHHTTAY